MSGLSYAKVLEALPDTGLSVRNLRDHTAAQHLPVKQAAKLLARQKDDLSDAVLPVARGLARSTTFARRVIDSVEQQVIAGTLRPGLADGLAAAKLLADFDGDGPSQDDLVEAIMSIVGFLKEEVDGPTFARLFHKIKALPAVAAI